jgi:predicted transcriptional regulator
MAEMLHVERNIKDVLSHGGFDEIDASIYTALTLAGEPMTATEIADGIGYAYSTTINALNRLIRLGHVSKHRRGRRNIYYPATDLTGIIQAELHRFVSLLKQTAHSIQQLDEQRQRIDDVLDMVHRSIRFLENTAGGET